MILLNWIKGTNEFACMLSLIIMRLTQLVNNLSLLWINLFIEIENLNT